MNPGVRFRLVNCAFATFKKPLDPEAVDAEIRRLAKEVFLDVLPVTRTGDGKWWTILHPKFEGIGCSVSIQTKKRLRFHRASGDESAGWVQHVCQHNLAKKFNGQCSDEGVLAPWSPGHNTTPTWREYFQMVFGHLPEMAEDLWKRQVAQLPDDLRTLAEK